MSDNAEPGPTPGLIDLQLKAAAPPRARRLSVSQRGRDWSNPARMPERFGIGLMLVALSVVSLGFFVLRLVDARASLVFFFTVLFTLIAIAQMLVPRQPRKASVIVGAVFCPLWAGGALLFSLMFERHERSLEVLAIQGVMMAFSLPFGGLVGYVAGGLVAGVFLVLGWSQQESPAETPQSAAADSTDDTSC